SCAGGVHPGGGGGEPRGGAPPWGGGSGFLPPAPRPGGLCKTPRPPPPAPRGPPPRRGWGPRAGGGPRGARSAGARAAAAGRGAGDLGPVAAEAHGLGFYVNLITSGVGMTEERIGALKRAGLDHIQLSFQDSTREMNDFLSSTRTFELKAKVAELIRRYDYP